MAQVVEKSEKTVTNWGEDPKSMGLDEFFSEISTFRRDFMFMKEDLERKRELEGKKKEMEEKRARSRLTKSGGFGGEGYEEDEETPKAGLRRSFVLPKKGGPGMGMGGPGMGMGGPLDEMMRNMSKGKFEFNLKKTTPQQTKSDPKIEQPGSKSPFGFSLKKTPQKGGSGMVGGEGDSPQTPPFGSFVLKKAPPAAAKGEVLGDAEEEGVAVSPPFAGVSLRKTPPPQRRGEEQGTEGEKNPFGEQVALRKLTT